MKAIEKKAFLSKGPVRVCTSSGRMLQNDVAMGKLYEGVFIKCNTSLTEITKAINFLN